MTKPDWWTLVEPEADAAIEKFTTKLRQKLTASPEKLVVRKNPFLFRVRVGNDAYKFAQMIADAYLSSSEETMFGNVLEEIAISVCKHSQAGWKSGADKIDLEFTRRNIRYLVQVKSGTNWGNSSQRQSLVSSFQKAVRILRQGNPSTHIQCIEGVCYGKSTIKDFGTHQQYVGHSFWQEISGWKGTAAAVLELVGTHASDGLNEARREAHDRILSYLDRSGALTQTHSSSQQSGDSEKYEIKWGRVLDLVLGTNTNTI